MARVRIECTTEAPHYDLSIYSPSFKLLHQCPPNTPFDGDLSAGEYLLAWRILGDELTTYKIEFTGVTDPQKPIERKIHKGQVAAADTRTFHVGKSQ